MAALFVGLNSTFDYQRQVVNQLASDLDIINTNIVINSGNIGLGTANPITKLHVNGNTLITGITTIGLGTTSLPENSQLSFELISNTNLRIKVRGNDGILRSANITLGLFTFNLK